MRFLSVWCPFVCGSTELLQPYGGPWHLHSHREEPGAFTAIGRNPVPSHSGVAQSMRISTAPSQPVYLRLPRIAAPPMARSATPHHQHHQCHHQHSSHLFGAPFAPLSTRAAPLFFAASTTRVGCMHAYACDWPLARITRGCIIFLLLTYWTVFVYTLLAFFGCQ